MEYKINQSELDTSFRVPSSIVDKHIRIATDNQLKVLLFILRTSPDSPDITELCKKLRMAREDAEDYLAYWVNAGVLLESGETVKPAAAPVTAQVSEPEKLSTPAPSPEITAQIFSKPSPAEIAERINESDEISCLFREAQNKLGKMIGYDLQCTLLMMHDYQGLPIEVIFMLLEYCASIGKTHNNYIASVGRTWGEKEIDTIEKAAERIFAMRTADNAWKEFSQSVGITVPKPTQAQAAYLSKWINEYKFPMDMIIAAYDEMANHTGKLSFPYIDKVLTTWHNDSIKSLDELKAAKANSTAVKSTKKPQKAAEREGSPSYDISLFDKEALSENLRYERKNKAK